MIAFKSFIDRSPFPMAATEGPLHLVRSVNPAFCAIHGKEVHEMQGRPIAETVPQFNSDSIIGLLDRVYLSAESGTVNNESFSDIEEEVVCGSYTAWAVPPSNKHASGLVIQASDTTRAAFADRQCEEARDELREINEKLLITGIRQHELAEIATQACEMLSKAFERERGIATALQYFVLSEEHQVRFPGLEVATIYEPALDEALVGGDFFDTIRLPSGKAMLVVGDVTGKGLKAAARTVEVKYGLRAFAQDHEEPADAAARMNEYICRSHPDIGWDNNELIALVLAVIDPIDGSAQFISAGGEPPFIVRASGTIEEVPTYGMMLGAQAGSEYDQLDRTLETGDVLILTTDGLTEARHGLNFFGCARIAQVVREIDPSTPLHDIGMAVVNTARDFGGGKFRDDVCILLARCK